MVCAGGDRACRIGLDLGLGTFVPTLVCKQSPSVLSNMPVSIEQHVEWVADCIDHMCKSGKRIIEVTPEAQDRWVAHVNEVVSATLMPRANSWVHERKHRQ